MIPFDNTTGYLLNVNGCKNTTSQHTSNAAHTAQNAQECVVFNYDGEKNLELNHINALFNCCPGEIEADFEFTGNTIIITERQTDPICLCICFFDVNFLIDNIAPAVYTIRINSADGEDREFTINLINQQSGSQCWDSPYWGNPSKASGGSAPGFSFFSLFESSYF